MIFGYARVSTDGQSVDAQVKQLRAAGAEKVFKETASGAKTDRAQLRRAIKAIDDGDTLLVTRLDRLARSTRDLLNTLAQITDKGAGADTDEAGHAFQSEAGHLYRSEAGHRSDLMSATGGLLPRIWVDDVSDGWIGQERVDFRAPNVAFAGFRR